LTNASDDQITAVTNLVWEIKRLFHALISGKASDVLADLNIVSGAKLSASLVTDLTASIPRDVVISAHQQWLPNLAKEIASGPIATGPIVSDQKQDGRSAETTEPAVTPETDAVTTDEASNSDDPPAAVGEGADTVKRDPPACSLRVLGQCLVFNGQTDANSKPSRSAKELPGRMNAGLKDAAPEAANAPPQKKAADQSDELLVLTDEELGAIKAHNKGAGKAGEPDRARSAPADAPAGSNPSAETPQTTAAPVITIASDVDPESWAAYGGWYRQDHAIFYRPIGHKDKFIYSWLFLTGPQAPKGNTSPAAAVFDILTSKDAQGSCTKCHSVDDLQGKGRVVNFSPPSVESKQGRFTNFIHEPHFGAVGSDGCLSCHKLEKDQSGAATVKTDVSQAKPDEAVFVDAVSKANAAAPAGPGAAAVSTDAEKGVSLYLKSYEQSNPHTNTSEFSAVKKQLCQTCHTSSKARQDCLTCHKYHVDGVNTPITNTKLPTQ
jgi:hypothetical protein